jgi:1-acyl-sn-glycerol-3-phosphate acyltransferase
MNAPSPSPTRAPRLTPLFRVTRVLVRALCAILFRLRVEGLELYPRGGALLVVNHPSAFDPAMVAVSVPDRVLFMAAEEYLEMPVVGWMMRAYGCIPVKRGAADTSAIRTALWGLAQGFRVCVFPEGQISPHPRPPQRGAALIAARAGVPVVPIAVIGSGNVFPLGARWPRFARVTVRVGPALPPPGPGSEAQTQTLDAAMRWIYAQTA